MWKTLSSKSAQLVCEVLAAIASPAAWNNIARNVEQPLSEESGVMVTSSRAHTILDQK